EILESFEDILENSEYILELGHSKSNREIEKSIPEYLLDFSKRKVDMENDIVTILYLILSKAERFPSVYDYTLEVDNEYRAYVNGSVEINHESHAKSLEYILSEITSHSEISLDLSSDKGTYFIENLVKVIENYDKSYHGRTQQKMETDIIDILDLCIYRYINEKPVYNRDIEESNISIIVDESLCNDLLVSLIIVLKGSYNYEK